MSKSVTGFASADNTAPFNSRYVGLFHYSTYWNKWDKILSIKGNRWTVQEVDLHGNPIGRVREHSTPMHANLFADKPFEAISIQKMLEV